MLPSRIPLVWFTLICESSLRHIAVDSAEDAQVIPAALPIQQVIYYLSKGFYYTTKPDDSSTGQNYTISINLPVPAAAFWSLIIYNASELNLGLYQNPINRYSISDRASHLLAFHHLYPLLLAVLADESQFVRGVVVLPSSIPP